MYKNTINKNQSNQLNSYTHGLIKVPVIYLFCYSNQSTDSSTAYICRAKMREHRSVSAKKRLY